MRERLKFADFKSLYSSSLKSRDTEERLDMYFTRPVGLVFAILWDKLRVHPNAITVLSIILGAGAGYMFAHTSLTYNILGVVLLVLANFCDSTDGQLARLTHQQSLVGRVLDGLSGDVWFVAIYLGIVFRLSNQNVPGLQTHWGVGIFALCAVAGLLCHSPQASLADYYRQIHLYFLNNANKEFNTSEQQTRLLNIAKANNANWVERMFYSNYASYCRSQEKRTPRFQAFIKAYLANPSEEVRLKFIDGSKPLMKYTNTLTFNTRAIVLYVACLIDEPWIYPLFEIVVLSLIYINMHNRHERLCAKLTKEL